MYDTIDTMLHSIQQFMQKRLERKRISGLPLTILVVSFGYVALLLLGIAENVVTSNSIVRADKHIEYWLFALRYSDVVEFFLWVTLLCKIEIVGIVVSTTLILCVLWNKRSYIIPLLLGLLGSGSIVYVGKLVFQRARPEETGVYTETLFSFPSGHAAIAVTLYGFIAYILSENAKHWSVRISASVVTFYVIALIGVSRLYLGVHYFSDIVGGYLLGLLWLMMAIGIREWLHHTYPKLDAKPVVYTTSQRYMLSAIIILIGISLYIITALYFVPRLVTVS